MSDSRSSAPVFPRHHLQVLLFTSCVHQSHFYLESLCNDANGSRLELVYWISIQMCIHVIVNTLNRYLPWSATPTHRHPLRDRRAWPYDGRLLVLSIIQCLAYPMVCELTVVGYRGGHLIGLRVRDVTTVWHLLVASSSSLSIFANGCIRFTGHLLNFNQF